MATPDSAISLEDKLTAAARAERLARAHSLVQNYVLASASIALVPLPLLDLAGITAVQVKLVHGLATHYAVPFKRQPRPVADRLATLRRVMEAWRARLVQPRQGGSGAGRTSRRRRHGGRVRVGDLCGWRGLHSAL